MRKIMILSDTHMSRYGEELPGIVIDYLKSVDMIIHAGDFQTHEVYEMLKKYKGIIAVSGNNDDHRLKTILPRRAVFMIEKVKIGLFHGHGLISKVSNSLNRAIQEFNDDMVDIVIFGHSHSPLHKKINNTTYFNPGSPTNKRWEPQYSFGILTVDNEQYFLEHIYYDTK